MKYGDSGDKFYIILKGEVKVIIPNPKIKNWRFKRNDYLHLRDWKNKLVERYQTLKLEQIKQ